MNSVLNKLVLVLNQNYEPMMTCNVKKALILIFLEKAEVIAKHDRLAVHTVNHAYPFPSIVRLSRYIQTHSRKVILSRKNIFKRDGYQCQYCGNRSRFLTVDHVIPKVRNGNDTWENLVTACVECNKYKGDKTPEQSGLALIRKPRRPSYLTFLRMYTNGVDEKWKPYLFMG